MNIAFLYKSAITPTCGGIQRVTHDIAELLRRKGHKVFYIGIGEGDSQWQLTLPNADCDTAEENLRAIGQLVRERKIDTVIFQDGISPHRILWAKAAKESGARLISCVHNTLIGDTEYLADAEPQKFAKAKWLLAMLKSTAARTLFVMMRIMRKRRHYKQLSAMSERVVLLSDKFMCEAALMIMPLWKAWLHLITHSINDISGLQITGSQKEKWIAVGNPILAETDIRPSEKENRLLFVGRITYQKGIDKLLQIWQRVNSALPDWHLDIVGEGPQLSEMKQEAQRLKLPRITFAGRQNPEMYYRRSKILCMTSVYEGFGVVLTEAQTYGAVPIAFDSYRSASDIITDGINGYLIKPFDIDEYCRTIIRVASSNDLQTTLMRNMPAKLQKFSLGTIGAQWEDILNSIRR